MPEVKSLVAVEQTPTSLENMLCACNDNFGASGWLRQNEDALRLKQRRAPQQKAGEQARGADLVHEPM
jgi:hypothetical protein